jgi:hypothetical protein
MGPVQKSQNTSAERIESEFTSMRLPKRRRLWLGLSQYTVSETAT